MTITAKFPGRCKSCGGSIAAGERIEWARGRGSRHVSCDTQQRDRPAPSDTAPASAPVRYATAPMLAFIARLGGSITGEIPTFEEAGRMIEELKAAEREVRASLPDATVVPAGRYALELDGELRFVKVWRKGERVNVYDDDEYGVTLPPQTLQAIADAGAFDCATRYGQLRCRCSRCGIKLKNRLSVELAIGPECIKHFHDDVTRLEMVNSARDAIRARGLDPKETV